MSGTETWSHAVVLMDHHGYSLQVNHLATALVTMLLIPNLVRAAQEHNTYARLVAVGSAVHAQARLDKVLPAANLLGALNDKKYSMKRSTMMHRYYDSKRAALSLIFREECTLTIVIY